MTIAEYLLEAFLGVEEDFPRPIRNVATAGALATAMCANNAHAPQQATSVKPNVKQTSSAIPPYFYNNMKDKTYFSGAHGNPDSVSSGVYADSIFIDTRRPNDTTRYGTASFPKDAVKFRATHAKDTPNSPISTVKQRLGQVAHDKLASGKMHYTHISGKHRGDNFAWHHDVKGHAQAQGGFSDNDADAEFTADTTAVRGTGFDKEQYRQYRSDALSKPVGHYQRNSTDRVLKWFDDKDR